MLTPDSGWQGDRPLVRGPADWGQGLEVDLQDASSTGGTLHDPVTPCAKWVRQALPRLQED